MKIKVVFNDGLEKTYNSFEDITCLKNYNDIKFIDCSYIRFECYCSYNQYYSENRKLTELPTLPDTLIKLYCSGNELTELPILPYSLKELYCFYNQLTELPRLPDSLEILWCYSNQLTELPRLSDSLKHLDCSNNQLTKLLTLPTSLEYFYCYNNQLIELPNLPDSLKIFNGYHNQLTELPNLPDSLKIFNCYHNQLIELPTLPNSIVKIIYDGNPIYDFIAIYFNQDIYHYQEWKLNYQKKYVHKISDWFLECKGNPKYAYCRRYVDGMYDEDYLDGDN